MNNIRKQKLASSFPSLRRRDLGAYPHMFHEDMGNYVAPLSGRSEKYLNFGYDFTGHPDDIKKAKNLLASLDRYNRREDKEIVSNAINAISKNLFYYGKAVFEIDPTKGELASITPNRLYKFFNHFFQVVPQKDIDTFGKRILVQDLSNVWVIDFPAPMKSHFYWQRMLFLRLANEVTPNSMIHGSVYKGSTFDLEEYSRKKITFVHKLTEKFFWGQRSSVSKYFSEYYLVFRYLKKRAAKAKIRKHIVADINVLFLKVNLNVTLTERGLPTETEIQNTIRELEKGEVGLDVLEKYDH